MDKQKLYISTIASDAVRVAKEYGLNLEIAEFCTAWNMDEEFAVIDPVVQKKLASNPKNLLHAPYNELFPCAIDKKARALAAERYRHAITLAKGYGSEKVIIHGGYQTMMYFPVWYTEQSILFWREFLNEDPGVEIVLENVLEEEPDWLLDIIKAVAHPRLRMCLDIGHVNAYSGIPVMEWLERCAPYISHFHIHNNDGSRDEHRALNEGTIPIKGLLLQTQHLCPDATYTLELMNDAPSVVWLQENDLI